MMMRHTRSTHRPSVPAVASQCRRRDGDAVPHPAGLDQQLAAGILVEQPPPHRPDHLAPIIRNRSSRTARHRSIISTSQSGSSHRTGGAAAAPETGCKMRARASGAARCHGAWDRWHSATAAASAASAGSGGPGRASSWPTMRFIWSLSAPPQPADGLLDLGRRVLRPPPAPAAAATAMARPATCATPMAVRALTWKNTRSTATTEGRNSEMSALQLSASAQRGALGVRLSSGSVRIDTQARPLRCERAAFRTAPNLLHHAVPAARQSWVDPQYEHQYEP